MIEQLNVSDILLEKIANHLTENICSKISQKEVEEFRKQTNFNERTLEIILDVLFGFSDQQINLKSNAAIYMIANSIANKLENPTNLDKREILIESSRNF